MPQLGMTGKGTISADGKSMASSWSGFVTGSCTSTLETDESGKVVKIISDNGVTLTRIDR
jgi:hypothetical protein